MSGSNRDCVTQCNFDVDVDVDVKQPRIHCHPISKRSTEFDIALEFDIKPHCCVKPRKPCKEEDGCVRRCVFTVELDFDCEPKIVCQPCNRPHAEYEVSIEIETAPSCKPNKICRKKDNSKTKDSDDDFDVDTPKQNRRW